MPPSTVSSQRQRPRLRRGSSYVFVLVTGLLLSVVCSSVLVVSRIGGRGLRQSNDSREAELLAENAIETALERINTSASWRTAYTNNVEISPITVGAGTMSFKLIDESDANLSNVNTDAFRIYGIGRVRNATKLYSVQAAINKPLSCLWVALQSGSSTSVSLATINGGATMGTNGTFSATSATLTNINVEATTSWSTLLSSGSGYRRLVAARRMPDTTAAFDYYRTNGTAVAITNFSTNIFGTRLIQNRLFSPANNPVGGTANSAGIYVIDCGGANVLITNCRVVGTLVLWNAGSSSSIQQSEYWVPAVSNYPTLLVKGDMSFQLSSSTLQDSSGSAINYNPAGTPYNGVADATYSTSYPSQIEGLVYVSGAASISSSTTLKGCIIAGTTVSVGGTLNLSYDATFYNNPPPGFIDTAIAAPVPGTWKWEAAP